MPDLLGARIRRHMDEVSDLAEAANEGDLEWHLLMDAHTALALANGLLHRAAEAKRQAEDREPAHA